MALANEDLQAIALLLKPLQDEINSVRLTLENETNRNIKLIAEGHLENELRIIKERLSGIA